MQPPVCYNFNMSVLSSVGIVILAMLIMTSLQLVPGVFALFYHYAVGRYSPKKVSSLSLFFILGTETLSTILFISTLYISYTLFLDNLSPRNNILTWIFTGCIIALAIISFCFYYRRPHASHNTQLFLPRDFAECLDLRARSVKSPSDAFVLGALSSVYELIFTLPLYLITATEIMYMHNSYTADHLFTILYILTPALPLFCLYYSFRSGRHLADIQKSRVKSKTFHRFLISICYLTIAVLIIYFRILT